MTKTGMTKKTVKKKTVKKLETPDSLNPVIGKMEQEVLKKKQKFKVEEKNEQTTHILTRTHLSVFVVRLLSCCQTTCWQAVS